MRQNTDFPIRPIRSSLCTGWARSIIRQLIALIHRCQYWHLLPPQIFGTVPTNLAICSQVVLQYLLCCLDTRRSYLCTRSRRVGSCSRGGDIGALLLEKLDGVGKIDGRRTRAHQVIEAGGNEFEKLLLRIGSCSSHKLLSQHLGRTRRVC